MQLAGAANQNRYCPLFCADGTIAVGGTPQLVLPQTPARAFLTIQNTSAGTLVFEFGSARATATIVNGVVTAIAVTNGGFGFSLPPNILLFGGGNGGVSGYVGLGQPGGAAPSAMMGVGRPATAHAVMSGTAPNMSVASIVVDDGGAGYVTAPYVAIHNSNHDPNGCATPSATSGMVLPAGSAPIILNGTSCPTDAIAVFGMTAGQSFLARWMP